MKRLIVGLTLIIIGALGATLFLISRGHVAHSEAAPATGGDVATDLRSRPAPNAAPAPQIAPGRPGVKPPARNSVNLPDPTSYPEGLLISEAGKREERGDREAKSRAALDRFFAKAQLDSTQQGQFMQILEDVNTKLLHRGDGYMKTGDPSEKATAAQREAIEHEGYQKVKTLLTAEQYKVFCDEIGQGMSYVAGYSLTRSK